MYSINFKSLFITFINFSVFISITFLLFSCSLLDYDDAKLNLRPIQEDIKKNKCPKSKIPFITAKYVANEKYVLNIKKIEMFCKNNLLSQSKSSEIIIRFKVIMELEKNRKIETKDLTLPNVYIAIVDMEKENILAKMVSAVTTDDNEENLIVNNKKIAFKYENYENLSIYFGLQ